MNSIFTYSTIRITSNLKISLDLYKHSSLLIQYPQNIPDTYTIQFPDPLHRHLQSHLSPKGFHTCYPYSHKKTMLLPSRYSSLFLPYLCYCRVSSLLNHCLDLSQDVLSWVSGACVMSALTLFFDHFQMSLPWLYLFALAILCCLHRWVLNPPLSLLYC